MSPTRTIAHCDLVLDLLKELIERNSDTHLIVCMARSDFLRHLAVAIHSEHNGPAAATNRGLLTRTIGLLAKSSKIRVTFCPSIESLRAYLTVISPAGGGEATKDETRCQDRPFLAVLNMIALHATTLEFAAQGISRTLASVVETSFRAGLDLRLYECLNPLDRSSTDWGRKLWDVNVPLLNGSVRMRGDENTVVKRGVTVKRVAERWFKFDEDYQTETEE